MILSRFIEHVKKQHWTGAFIELAIVILGVFIGLQANDWNQNRLKKIRSHEYMVRIRADLEDDADQLQKRIDFWTAVSQQGHIALAYAEKGEMTSDSPWITLRAFLRATEIWRFTYNSATYGELRSAGQLELIPDPALRSALSDYYITNVARRGPGLYLLLPKYRETARGTVPLSLMHYYWKACHRDTQLTQALTNCASPITNTRAETILKKLVETPNLVAQLRYWMDTLGIDIRLAAYDKQAAQKLATRIGKSLQ